MGEFSLSKYIHKTMPWFHRTQPLGARKSVKSRLLKCCFLLVCWKTDRSIRQILVLFKFTSWPTNSVQSLGYFSPSYSMKALPENQILVRYALRQPIVQDLWVLTFFCVCALWIVWHRERSDEIGKKIKREADVASSYPKGRRHMLGPSGTLNTITPCAACKLLRRRCAQECPFSPYFSPHEPQKFASVHKVFGASNVSKMLMVMP